jgi:lipoprotein-anchoring transpeptidase ErfK/SrfK
MKSARLLFLFIGLSVLTLVLLKFGLTTYTAKSLTVGCSPLTDSGNIDPTSTVAFWLNRPISPPLALNSVLNDTQKQILGTTIPDDKWIEIDLKNQRLIAHEGDTVFLESPISSGLYNSTPPGEYHVWYKIRSTLMEGGSKLNNTYYYLPNVPYAMFFYGDYGIHGVYWHSNFGHPMSHGCVNAPTDIAEKLFYWTTPQLPSGKGAVRASADHPGTRVVIHP